MHNSSSPNPIDRLRQQLRRLYPDVPEDPESIEGHDDCGLPQALAVLLEQAAPDLSELFEALSNVIANDPKFTQRPWWPRAQRLLMALAPDQLIFMAQQLATTRGRLQAAASDPVNLDETRTPKPIRGGLGNLIARRNPM